MVAVGGRLATGEIGRSDLLAIFGKSSRIQSTHRATLDRKADGAESRAEG
jgi:hypothetical protein